MKTNSRNHCRFLVPPAATALLFLAAGVANADYPTTVLNDGPAAYYRLDENPGRSTVNTNSGSALSVGNATNLNVHPFPGAIVGSGNRSTFFDSTARSIIPWTAALNPPSTQPFTVEAWFYPASDQINGGQAVMNNRYAYSGVDRQGWVIFQRAPDATYTGKAGFEGVGWNFRMYRGSGGSAGLDVVSQVPYQVGKWTHVVVVYEPLELPTATLTMYIDGVAASTNTWTGPDPGYAANSNDHPESEAVNGPSGIAFGSYNNTQPGSNPYFGAVDEFALYTNKLSATQILAHYQNATNAARSTPYETLVRADKPAAYLRLDELPAGPDVVLNLGNLQAAGVATNTAAVRTAAGSALAGRPDDRGASYRWSQGGRTSTLLPWLADNNPAADVPFTFEAWLRPTSDRMNPGPSPANNRLANGVANRTGWVIYQRDPNESYKGPPAVDGESGVGWNFRLYTGTGGSGQDVITGVPYTVGEWQHLVVTWEPQTDVGPAANGNVAWQGALTAYVDGVPVATNSAATYSANANPTEDGRDPADLAIGSYNAASGFGEEFEGDIDEVAFYRNYVLTPAQILSHYQAATQSDSVTNYETLVLTAAYDGAAETPQRLMPATYLRFNDPVAHPAVNRGTVGSAADGAVLATTPVTAGPQPPKFAGFDAANSSAPFDGVADRVALNNPVGLNLSGHVSLEAWIKPGATQGERATILSRGPPTPTAYDLQTYPLVLAGSLSSSNEVFLRIESGTATNYVVGTSDGFTGHGASYAVPAEDLSGTTWVHLVGTYDGTAWKLYRNGSLVATAADAVGALPAPDAEWSLGSSGNGGSGFFTGAIDEAAIYPHALSASQVGAHYSAGLGGPSELKLNIVAAGGQISITWSSGTLQAADTVTGPFTPVASAQSPYTVAPQGAAKFYRLGQ